LTARLRIGFLLDRHGALEAAGIVGGDLGEGARFLAALQEPLNKFLEEARREAVRLSTSSPEILPAGKTGARRPTAVGTKT
jgi:hypothetical protein